MKLMYFLRGVGVGIVFCALVLFVAYKTNPVKMSDEDVIKKAKELGMVEADATTDPLDELLDNKDADKSDETTEVATTEKTTATEEKTTEAATEATTESAKAEEKTTQEATTQEVAEDKKTEEKAEESTETAKTENTGKTVSFSVAAGMVSENVAAGLEQLGVVKNANEFNKYLCDNGYANRIAVGTYEFTVGEDYASIAKKITR